LDLTQIRYFLALARSLNFTRAAAECGVTQPALSRAIQRLEETLGAPLVLRERSLTQLTEFGRVMLPLLEETHQAAEAARARASERLRARDEVPLRLGICPFLALGPLFGPLQQVAGAIPGACLALRRAPEADLLEMLLQGEIDLALMPQLRAMPERLHALPLWSAGAEAWLPAGHALAREAGPLPVEALRDEPLIGLTPEFMAPATVEALRTRLGLTVPRRHSANGPEELGAMVALGLGWGLAPAGCSTPPGTCARPLDADPPLRLEVVLARVAGRPMNRAVQHFLRLVQAGFVAEAAE